jgi:hypothetical protein
LIAKVNKEAVANFELHRKKGRKTAPTRELPLGKGRAIRQ